MFWFVVYHQNDLLIEIANRVRADWASRVQIQMDNDDKSTSGLFKIKNLIEKKKSSLLYIWFLGLNFALLYMYR